MIEFSDPQTDEMKFFIGPVFLACLSGRGQAINDSKAGRIAAVPFSGIASAFALMV